LGKSVIAYNADNLPYVCLLRFQVYRHCSNTQQQCIIMLSAV